MKLSTYARQAGVSYKTAWRWWKSGQLDAYQAASGTIVVREEAVRSSSAPEAPAVAIYARVSSAENRPNLESQADRVQAYCAARGYQIRQVVREVGSGVNDTRPKFLKLLTDPTVTVIVVEHKDRATRFGFRYLETLLAQQGRRIEVVNMAEDGRDDVVADLVAIVYSFCARLYGLRRASRKMEALVQELLGEELLGEEGTHAGR